MTAEQWITGSLLLAACVTMAWWVWPGVRPKLDRLQPAADAPLWSTSHAELVAEVQAVRDRQMAADLWKPRAAPHPVLLLRNRRRVRVPLRLIRR